MRRRAFGFGGAVLLVVVAALVIRGCLEAREQRAYEDHVQEVSSLVTESQQQGEALFELLDDPSNRTAVDVQNTLNGYSIEAERLVERAEAADPPDELVEAHGLIVQTLALRRDGLEGVSRAIPTALGDEERDEAIESIATDMQSFLASDVIYADQAVPAVEDTLDREDLAVEVEDLPESRFLPDIEWLQPDRMEKAVEEIPASEGAPTEEPAP